MRGGKLHNEYAAAIGGELYARTPKAVFAALAFSYAQAQGAVADPDDPGNGDETLEADVTRARLLNEWRILHENGIVPQAPPK